jgi:general secretion pathway protein H
MKTLIKNEGFTLIEMLVVLGLMALLLTISLPYSTSSGLARKIEVTSEIVAAKLRETQAAAIWANRERAITINVAKGLITQTEPVRTFTFPDGIHVKAVTIGNEVIADAAAIRFFPDGGSTGGKITLSMGNIHTDIAVNWLTGAIVVSRGDTP